MGQSDGAGLRVIFFNAHPKYIYTPIKQLRLYHNISCEKDAEMLLVDFLSNPTLLPTLHLHVQQWHLLLYSEHWSYIKNCSYLLLQFL